MREILQLTIGGVLIQLSSRFPIEKAEEIMGRRFQNFFYSGKRLPSVQVKVEVVKNLPVSQGARDLFVTTHFQDGNENWRWKRSGKHFIYTTPVNGKEQYAVVNQAFDKAVVYVLPKTGGRFAWNVGDIIYDFLQILLINYLAHRDGVFVHGIGLKDTDGSGLLFAGKSGAGKSTTARLWHAHSRATILNDDRIIVRKRGGRFIIYGTPWHGDFSDYLASAMEPAPLKRLFFIYHARKHVNTPMATAQAFCELYPCLFPSFWDKRGLERTAAFCHDLLRHVSVQRLGFRKDRSVIPFVRRIQ